MMLPIRSPGPGLHLARQAPKGKSKMAAICTINISGNPVCVVSTFNPLLVPSVLAAALEEGEWLVTLLKDRHGWDGLAPVSATASTPIELDHYARGFRQAQLDGGADKDHFSVDLPVALEPAAREPLKRRTAAKRQC
jgi:hypothetical protein